MDHVDFITKALEKRVAMETERIFAALDELDTNQTGKICLQVRTIVAPAIAQKVLYS